MQGDSAAIGLHLASGVSAITVDAGDRTDAVYVSLALKIRTDIDGGSGDDTLTGGGGEDSITGGTGNDTLSGRSGNDPSLTPGLGNDVTDGGDGNDVINAGLLDGADQFHGGNGTDKIVYTRFSGVTVSLDTHSNDGAPGENDFVAEDIETVVGGQTGSNTLIGNDLPNHFLGGDGHDDLTGGGGADTLGGAPGDDILRDDLDGNQNSGDEFDCGAGVDTAFIDLVDQAAGKVSGCENIFASAVDQHPNVVIKVGKVVPIVRRRIKLPLLCPQEQQHGCIGDLALKRGKHDLGGVHYSLAPGGRVTETFKLSASEVVHAKRRPLSANVV